MLSSDCTKNSSAELRRRPCCPQRKPRRCYSGRSSRRDRSQCERSLVGRRFRRSSFLTALTSQRNPLFHCIGDTATPNFHTIRDGTLAVIPKQFDDPAATATEREHRAAERI